jgi:hypothetical protein
MKRRLSFVGAIIIASTVIMLDSCKKDVNSDYSNTTVLSEGKTQNEALRFIEENLNSQFVLLTSTDDRSENVKKSSSFNYHNTDLYTNAVQTILNRKEKLGKDDFKYVSFKLKINSDETTLKVEGNKIIAKVAVDYSMPTNSIDSETGTPIVTEGTDYYDYEIQKENNGWKILKEEKSIDFPVVAPSSEIENVSPVNDDESSNTRSIASYTYSAPNAVAYAVLHYNHPSTSYADYSSFGGDCTNFASQCMKAGGWAMNNSWKYNGPNIPQRTPSWTGAYKFYEYLTTVGSSRVVYIFHDIPLYSWSSLPSTIEAFKNATSVVNKGDIVQLSTTTVKTSVHHSTIVTSKDAIAKKVFVTYRNATGYPVAKDRYVGDFSGGYTQGFKVKTSGI